MKPALRRLMDALYAACVAIAGTALVLISAVIPWAVYTRYVLNRAASWPEPMAVLLMTVLTFFGAAACYRAGLHMRMSFFLSLLPLRLQRAMAFVVELLMALIALFMVDWGDEACCRDMAEFRRRLPFAVGRGDLSTDPARRRDPFSLRHRAARARPAAHSGRRARRCGV